MARNAANEVFDSIKKSDDYMPAKSFADVIKIVQKPEIVANKMDGLLEMARLAEHAERYEDMCYAMKQLIKTQSDKLGPGMKNFVLTVEARNMLSVAFKNEVGKRRSAYRNLTTEDENKNMVIVDDSHNDFKYNSEYARSPRTELNEKCEEILTLLDECLIDKTAKEYWMGLAAKAKEAFPDPAKGKEKEPENSPHAIQEKRQKHVLAAWMTDTLKDTLPDNYPIIWGKQTQDGGMDDLKAFCEKYKPAVSLPKCANIRQLEDPDNKISKKDFNQEFMRKGSAFDLLQTSVETLVFYLKMCGDYKRYLAEMMADDDNALKNAAIQYYEDAFKTAELILQATHPTRLGLSLNMSVCYYEIAKDQDSACALAKNAFDLAIQQLDGLSDDNYKDSTLIMQLLRDNLTIWQNDNNNDGGVQPDGTED